MDPASSRLGWPSRAGWLAFGVSLWLLALPPTAHAETPTAEPATVPGQLVVGFDDSASSRERRQVVSQAGAKIDESLEAIDGAVVVLRDGTTPSEAIKHLDDADAVSFVEPNYVLRD